MICPEYQQLNPIEQRNYIGSLIHACMNCTDYFNIGQAIIDSATRRGVFEGVTFNPAPVEDINTE